MNNIASRPLLDGKDLDTAIIHARAALEVLLRVPGGGDGAWPEVALTLGRLSYDRHTDPWPDAEPPDPDDLDAACDLLLRGAVRRRRRAHHAVPLPRAPRPAAPDGLPAGREGVDDLG